MVPSTSPPVGSKNVFLGRGEDQNAGVDGIARRDGSVMADSPITSRDKDFAAWYQDVVLQGDMAEPAEIVKGCMVIKPNGYAVWEGLQGELDRRFKATGHRNINLPLLIPQSFV